MSYLIKSLNGRVQTLNGKPVLGSDLVQVFKSVNEAKREITIVGTDETKDRQGDIVMMAGWDLKNFLSNPVFLWAHDYGSVPIAGATKVEKKRSPKRLVFTEKFPKEGLFPFADLIYELYKIRQINASSVGFIALDWEDIKDDSVVGGGGWDVPRRFLKQELLELSGCAVPANPAALQDAMKSLTFRDYSPDDLFRQLSTGKVDPPKKPEDVIDSLNVRTPIFEETDEATVISMFVKGKAPAPEDKDETFQTVMAEPEPAPKVADPAPETTPGAMAAASATPEDPEEKGVGASRTLPLAEKETAWDGAGAKTAIAKWASNDGSGEKDKMDWPKYRKAFCWYDPEDMENFSGYKMPIATVDGGSLKAVYKGVVAAMGALNGARGGADIPDADRSKIYNLLAHYYRRFEEEPPEQLSFSDLAKAVEAYRTESANEKIRMALKIRELAVKSDGLLARLRLVQQGRTQGAQHGDYIRALLSRRRQ